MKKLMRIVRKILTLIIFLSLAGIIYSFGVTTYENVAVDNQIKFFKRRADKEPTMVTQIGDTTAKYYEVPRETDRELSDTRSVFSDLDKIKPGRAGDILVTQESPFPQIPVIHQFVSYYFGGHAALVTGDDRIVEATGMGVTFGSIIDMITHDGYGEEDNNFEAPLVENDNYWFSPNLNDETDVRYKYYGEFFRNEIIVLRVDSTQEERNQAIKYAEDKVEKNAFYNFLFFLDTTYKYYCTDIVSRAYESIYKEQAGRKIRVNDDGFITSVNDLILSKDTYITIYKETVKNRETKEKEQHIYYLADI